MQMCVFCKYTKWTNPSTNIFYLFLVIFFFFAHPFFLFGMLRVQYFRLHNYRRHFSFVRFLVAQNTFFPMQRANGRYEYWWTIHRTLPWKIGGVLTSAFQLLNILCVHMYFGFWNFFFLTKLQQHVVFFCFSLLCCFCGVLVLLLRLWQNYLENEFADVLAHFSLYF